MPQPRDLPTDLEWFRAQELSPDDLDDDDDRQPGDRLRPAGTEPAAPPPADKPRH